MKILFKKWIGALFRPNLSRYLGRPIAIQTLFVIGSENNKWMIHRGRYRQFRKRRPKLNKIETWLYNYKNTQRTVIGRTKTFWKYKKKIKGAAAPSAPPLNPPMIQRMFLPLETIEAIGYQCYRLPMKTQVWKRRGAVCCAVYAF